MRKNDWMALYVWMLCLACSHTSKEESVRGQLIIGYEVCSLSPCGESEDYWLVDKTGQLARRYNERLNSVCFPYTPMYVELKVKDLGKSDEGFAAEYDGIYEVTEIVRNTSNIPENCR